MPGGSNDILQICHRRIPAQFAFCPGRIRDQDCRISGTPCLDDNFDITASHATCTVYHFLYGKPLTIAEIKAVRLIDGLQVFQR